MTFAVTSDGSAELAGVAGPGDAALILPESVSYEGIDYMLTSIAPYAFYLSGATSVVLPATIADVDDRAFRSSEVSSVEVAEGNPTYASFDGALYDAGMTRLLLIPGGRQGAVRIPSQASDVPASAFSHCALVTAIDADAGGAAYLSWEGLLYDADGTTLIRVPAGATDITIRDGCTAIAAGAMEGCASLAVINAPASVTSISPDVFANVPTVTLLAASVVADSAADAGEGSDDSAPEASDPANVQLSAMVALSSADDDLPAVDPAAVAVSLPAGADSAPWRAAGFSADEATKGNAEEQDAVPTADSVVPQDVALSNEEDSGSIEDDASGLSGASTDSVPLVSLDSAATYAAGKVHLYSTQQRYSRSNSESGAVSSWKASGDPGAWSESSVGYAQYRFYNGHFWYRKTADWGGQAYVEIACSSSGQSWNHAKVGSSSSGPWTELSANSSWTAISSALYIVLWNDPWTVTLDKQDGSGGTASPVIIEPPGGSMPTVTKPALSGWTFSGYTDDFTDNPYLYTKADGSPTTRVITGDKTIRANWTKTVTFSANGGTQGTLKTLTALKGQPLGRVCTQVASSHSDYPIHSLFQTSLTPSGWKPTRTGYTFAGFYDTSAASGGTQWVDASGNLKVATCPANTPSTLYARWTGNPYTVSFSANGGSGGQSANVTATYGSAMPAISTTKPTKAGYTFGGWYDTSASTGGTQYYTAAGASARAWNRTSNTTLYARWTANSYTVEYWNKAGTTKLSSDTGFKYDTARNLAAKPSSGVSAGYTAVGWATSTNQTKATYGFGSSQKNLATSGTKKLYLAETANTIRTTWDYNGGMIDGNTGSTYRDTVYASGKKLGDALESDFWSEGRVSRPGYSFDGWYTAATGGSKVTQSTTLPSSNAAYYAHWTAKTISITWNANRQGAAFLVNNYPSAVATQSVKYSEGETLGNAGLPQRWVYTPDGYTFKGWYDNPYGHGSTLDESTALPTEDTDYFAHWEANSYTITLDPGEGASVTPTSVVATYDASVTLPIPASRAGYVFQGWDTELDGSGNRYKGGVELEAPNIATEGTVFLYAQWAPAIRADVPVSSTVRLDLLGTEEQAMDEDAPGYIESRCGEPLDVASVAFEAKPGAAELFGAYVPDIDLQALPGKDASWETGSPAFSFALDAAGDAAIEDDASKLAGLSMSGYEVRIPIAYRFAIPDSLLEEVLASIDPARFEQMTTPVCSVVYTVALAN